MAPARLHRSTHEHLMTQDELTGQSELTRHRCPLGADMDGYAVRSMRGLPTRRRGEQTRRQRYP
jgi:hypothetical protein